MDFDDLNAAKHSLYGPNMAGGEMVPFSEGQVPSLWKIPPAVVSLGARNLSAMVVSGLFGALQGYKDSMPALKFGNAFHLDLDLGVGLGLMALEVWMLWTGKRTQYLAAHALDGAAIGALCSYSNALGMMSGAKQKKRSVLTVKGDDRYPVFQPPMPQQYRPPVQHQPPVPRPQPAAAAAAQAPSFDPRFPFTH